GIHSSEARCTINRPHCGITITRPVNSWYVQAKFTTGSRNKDATLISCAYFSNGLDIEFRLGRKYDSKTPRMHSHAGSTNGTGLHRDFPAGTWQLVREWTNSDHGALTRQRYCYAHQA